MKRLTLFLMTLLFISTTAFGQIKAKDYEWLKSIRTDHPRMFFTAEDIPLIKSNAILFDEALYNGMVKRTERLIERGYEFKNELNKNKYASTPAGSRTADAAMLWVVTRDKRYLDFAKDMLVKLISHYELRIKNGLNVSKQSFTVIATLCAYDWIYNDLTIEERQSLGSRLYEVTRNIAWLGSDVRPKRQGETIGATNSAFHGTASLPWYVGLTFYGMGIDDEECANMLRLGYDAHQKMIAHRAKMLGKNGGSSSGSIGIDNDSYQYAEYNFIYTFRSATGIDIANQMRYMLGYLNYLDWARLPDNKEFGIGHSLHSDNKLPRSYVPHIKEIANLLVKSNQDKFDWFTSLVSRYNDNNTRPSSMTFLPLLHSFHFEGYDSDNVVDAKDKQSMHFKHIGQIIMRSGVDDRDTYAVFSTERKDGNRQHYDLNNFIIYKNGYRALDSGTRPQPGLHQSHYYCRTVAHNCVTIHMPAEVMPRAWGKAAPNEDADSPVPNDGGQCNNKNAKLLAHKESADYVYIASDATACYNEAKAEQVVREFVWIKPDIFVVYDRVVSDKAEYAKRWLYHTVGEPIVNGNEFVESSQGGKSICRTLLPVEAAVSTVGGEGKQFWSDGKNWAIPEYKPEDPQYKRSRKFPRNNSPLVGQWRVEVSPKKASTTDSFLHIIQVGDSSLTALPYTDCKDGKDEVTLKFDYVGKSYSLIFDKTQKYGCKIEVKNL